MPVQSIAHCRPCRTDMQVIEREAMGETYWCPNCGIVVELNFNRPTVVVDKCYAKHSALIEEGE